MEDIKTSQLSAAHLMQDSQRKSNQEGHAFIDSWPEVKEWRLGSFSWGVVKGTESPRRWFLCTVDGRVENMGPCGTEGWQSPREDPIEMRNSNPDPKNKNSRTRLREDQRPHSYDCNQDDVKGMRMSPRDFRPLRAYLGCVARGIYHLGVSDI